MNLRYIILLIGFHFMVPVFSQSGLVLGAGISMGFTENPAVRKNEEIISGFHVSLTGRFGADSWYLKPGIEVHRMKLKSAHRLIPFSDQEAMSILKFPVQLGLRLIRYSTFKVRIMAGAQFSYVASIQDNLFSIDHDTVRDTHLAALMGAGIDLSWISIELNFEKGLSEFYSGTAYTTDYVFVTMGFFF